MSDHVNLSPSALDMLSRCGEQYRFRYIEGLRIPPAVNMIVGRAVDQSVNVNLQTKIATGGLLEPDVVRDVAAETCSNEFDPANITLDEEERSRGIDAVRGEAIDKSVRLARLHHAEVAPAISPVHVQRRWELEVAGRDATIRGIVDVDEGPGHVRDTKTSKKAPTASAADDSEQLTAYALAHRVLDGAQEVEVALDHLVDLKTPKVVTLRSRRAMPDFERFLARVDRGLLAIRAGIFVPARPTDWWCSERWCGYHDRCPFARRPVQVAAVGGS